MTPKKEATVALDKKEAKQALAEMEDELNDTKGEAEGFLSDVGDSGPDDFDFGTEDESMSPEDKENVSKIKTPADAKKALNTAKDDIQNVLDALDGLTGQVSDEKEAIAFKRVNAKYSGQLISLAEQVDKAIADAKSAISYWSFLTKAKKRTGKVSESKVSTQSSEGSFDQVVESMEKGKTFVEKFAGLFGYVKATAVSPTGAEFSGDKWPNGKDPKEIEDRAWHAGAEKFDRDETFENSRVNPTVDHRLDTTEYPRNDKPYVNASFKLDKANKFSSFWEITDAKTGRKLVADFANVPKETGVKNNESFALFSSKAYGHKIVETVMEEGLESVQKQLGGKISKVTKEGLQAVAADKGGLRSYYTDAFGDSSYASELTAGSDNTKMNIGYTPKDDSVKSKKTETKDGTGKLSAKDLDIERAKAKQAVIAARKYASRGAIAFTQKAIFAKAQELLKLSPEEFRIRVSAIEEIPIVNEAALKEAHIPDTEVGIVGNTKEGVRSPEAKVKTEDIDSGVKSDATVKKSSFVPQVVSDDNALGIKYQFNTVASRLEQKGITRDKLRIAKKV